MTLGLTLTLGLTVGLACRLLLLRMIDIVAQLTTARTNALGPEPILVEPGRHALPITAASPPSQGLVDEELGSRRQ